MSRKNFVTILILSSVFISSIHPLSAQLLSVDINKTSDEGPKGANKPGYSAWYLGDQTGPNVQSATKFFTNYTYTYDPDTGLPNSTNISLIIPCTIAMTYPAATSTMYLLGKNQSKNGYSTSTDPNVGWRICIDGAFPWWNDNSVHNQPITSGGALNLTISNLPAGPHTITTYHNDPFAPPQDNGTWFTDLTISRCIVSINGVPAFTNLPSVGCTNDNLCSSAFINFTNSYDGQPVTINFDPDHSSPQDFVVLNGFEIDRPFAPGMEAAVVSPLPGDDHAFANNDVPLPNTANSGWLPLQWVAAGFAVSNYVYFGTNLNAVTTATTASPEFKQLSAAIALATNSFVISNLNCVTTYYWRVDQLDIANGATNVVPGTVWSFRTRHLAFPTAEGYGRFSRG
jgi:hypothetical protein